MSWRRRHYHAGILDELLVMCDPEGEAYLAVDRRSRQIAFLRDMDRQRRDEGRLMMTDRQAAYLRDIQRQWLGQARTVMRRSRVLGWSPVVTEECLARARAALDEGDEDLF